MTLAVWLSLAALVAPVLPAPADPAPIETVLAHVPAGTGAVLTVEGMGGLGALDRSPFLERLRSIPKLVPLLDAATLGPEGPANDVSKMAFGVPFKELFDENLAECVALAYVPGATEGADAGVILWHAESPARLETLIQQLADRRVKGAKPLTLGKGKYWKLDGGKNFFIAAAGQVGLLTDKEDVLKSCLDPAAGAGSFKNRTAYKKFAAATARENVPETLLRAFIDPRNFDARMTRRSEKPVERAVETQVLAVWKAVDWICLDVEPSPNGVSARLRSDVDRERLPPAWRPMVAPARSDAAGPIPNRSDFLVTARGEIDFAAAARVLAAIVSESKDAQLAELTGPIASQVFWTRDFFRDVLPAFGPSFAAAAWPGAATVPNAVVGVAFREPTIAGVIPVSQVIEHSLRFLGVAAALDSYKPNHERWALELRQAGPARIHFLSGPPAKKGLAPGFAVHRGWLLAGTNPEALAESLAALDGPVKNEPSGLHVDLVQVRRLVERLPPASADDHKREVALLLLGVFDDFRATSKSTDGRREHRLEWTVRQAARP